MTTISRTVELPAVADPPGESSLRAFFVHSGVQCKRLLITWSRDSVTTVQALLFPALTLLMFWVVLGDSITAATGSPSVFGTVPMITLIGAMAGSTISALGLMQERSTGLLGRFATMPVHRAAGLFGRILAEAIRVLITTLVIIAVGFAIGFRFEQGPWAAIALILLPIVFGMGFAVLVTAIATVFTDTRIVDLVGILTNLLMFFNTGFVPVFAYPVWLQDIVANQPMSCAIDAMKGLSLGGPVAEPLLKTLAWSIGMIVVFAYPAVKGYQRAAQN